MSLNRENDEESSGNRRTDPTGTSSVFPDVSREIEFAPRQISSTEHSKAPGLSVRKKLQILYTAPRTKFFLNTVSSVRRKVDGSFD